MNNVDPTGYSTWVRKLIWDEETGDYVYIWMSTVGNVVWFFLQIVYSKVSYTLGSMDNPFSATFRVIGKSRGSLVVSITFCKGFQELMNFLSDLAKRAFDKNSGFSGLDGVLGVAGWLAAAAEALGLVIPGLSMVLLGLSAMLLVASESSNIMQGMSDIIARIFSEVVNYGLHSMRILSDSTWYMGGSFFPIPY